MSLPPLSNVQIDGLLQHYSWYGGAFTVSQLPGVRVQRNKAYIILMLPEGGGVGHWVSLMSIARSGDNSVYYFDSFGMPCSNDVMKFALRFRSPHMFRSNVDIQALRSDSCGEWCVYVAVQMMEYGESLNSVLAELSNTDPARNERYLYHKFSNRSM